MSRTLVLWLGLVSLLGVTGFVSLYRSQMTAAPRTGPVLVVSTDAPILTPRLALAQPQQFITVRNETGHALDLRTTPHAPAVVHLHVPVRSIAHVVLTVPGLYHLYDAATATVTGYVVGSDVVQARPHAPHPDLPNQGWIVVPTAQGVPLDAHVDVPAGTDLLSPRAMVMQVDGALIIHNYDRDAHNIVTDAADPMGVAFELFGVDDEPATQGAERRITLSAPGLYHLFCSMHTRMVGHAGPWHVVMPGDAQASGYQDHNPMDAWVLVVPVGAP